MNEKVNLYAEALSRELDLREVPYLIKRNEEKEDTIFTIPGHNDHLPQVRYIFLNDNGDALFFTYICTNVETRRRPFLYPLLSFINDNYKLVGMNLDSDGDVTMSCWLRMYGEPETAAREAFQTLARLDQICDDVIPPIMEQAFADFDSLLLRLGLPPESGKMPEVRTFDPDTEKETAEDPWDQEVKSA